MFKDSKTISVFQDSGIDMNSSDILDRLKHINSFLKNLVGTNPEFRLTLIRLFLFAEESEDYRNLINTRRVDVMWQLKNSKELHFPNSFEVEQIFAELVDQINLVNRFLHEFILTDLQAKRFAVLIYTVSCLLQIFSDGNKRTAHALATSYMIGHCDKLASEYSLIQSLDLINTVDYLSYSEDSAQTLTNILNYVLHPNAIVNWVNYISTGRFEGVDLDRDDYVVFSLEMRHQGKIW